LKLHTDKNDKSDYILELHFSILEA